MKAENSYFFQSRQNTALSELRQDALLSNLFSRQKAANRKRSERISAQKEVGL